MHSELRQAIQSELYEAKVHFNAQEYVQCFRKLERAHILSQHYAVAHTRVHWWMLKVGIKKKDFLEILGQGIRLIGGFLGSLVGKVPVGNSGGADVSAFAQMPIPDDLRDILIKDNKSWEAIKKAPNKAKA